MAKISEKYLCLVVSNAPSCWSGLFWVQWVWLELYAAELNFETARLQSESRERYCQKPPITSPHFYTNYIYFACSVLYPHYQPEYCCICFFRVQEPVLFNPFVCRAAISNVNNFTIMLLCSPTVDSFDNCVRLWRMATGQSITCWDKKRANIQWLNYWLVILKYKLQIWL